MIKIETITDACRALAEKYPEKYFYSGMRESFIGIKGTAFTERVKDLCACDFDSILELVGLEIEIYSKGSQQYGYRPILLDGILKPLAGTPYIAFLESYWYSHKQYYESKKLASEAAFIAAVGWLVNQNETDIAPKRQ
jgi:hypothetical protein